MAVYVAFFPFQKGKADFHNRNQALRRISERFKGGDHRIINIETVAAETFFGFTVYKGGLRVWYESDAEITGSSSIQKIFEEINS